ncbi:hypothetical protein HDU83_005148 [Entophlyctis luteolus]|nr:hypothetical protein HDU83_005148 [Entophlyctis luteolus]
MPAADKSSHQREPVQDIRRPDALPAHQSDFWNSGSPANDSSSSTSSHSVPSPDPDPALSTPSKADSSSAVVKSFSLPASRFRKAALNRNSRTESPAPASASAASRASSSISIDDRILLARAWAARANGAPVASTKAPQESKAEVRKQRAVSMPPASNKYNESRSRDSTSSEEESSETDSEEDAPLASVALLGDNMPLVRAMSPEFHRASPIPPGDNLLKYNGRSKSATGVRSPSQQTSSPSIMAKKPADVNKSTGERGSFKSFFGSNRNDRGEKAMTRSTSAQDKIHTSEVHRSLPQNVEFDDSPRTNLWPLGPPQAARSAYSSYVQVLQAGGGEYSKNVPSSHSDYGTGGRVWTGSDYGGSQTSSSSAIGRRPLVYIEGVSSPEFRPVSADSSMETTSVPTPPLIPYPANGRPFSPVMYPVATTVFAQQPQPQFPLVSLSPNEEPSSMPKGSTHISQFGRTQSLPPQMNNVQGRPLSLQLPPYGVPSQNTGPFSGHLNSAMFVPQYPQQLLQHQAHYYASLGQQQQNFALNQGNYLQYQPIMIWQMHNGYVPATSVQNSKTPRDKKKEKRRSARPQTPIGAENSEDNLKRNSVNSIGILPSTKSSEMASSNSRPPQPPSILRTASRDSLGATRVKKGVSFHASAVVVDNPRGAMTKRKNDRKTSVGSRAEE